MFLHEKASTIRTVYNDTANNLSVSNKYVSPVTARPKCPLTTLVTDSLLKGRQADG